MRVLIFILIAINLVQAKGKIEKSGDILMFALPITTFATTIILKDKEGSKEFLKSFALTSASTYLLKRVVREKRPIGSSRMSFPSGHTSSAFASAAFIHKRYGLKYAILPYTIATFIAYSRVQAKKHYIHDVIAGAALGIASSFYFTKRYKNIKITPWIDGKKAGININYKY